MEPTFAVVEVMGYQVYAGRVSTAQVFGASFCQIEVPETHAGPAFTVLIGGASIYRLTPCSEEETLRLAPRSPRPLSEEALRKALPAGESNGVDLDLFSIGDEEEFVPESVREERERIETELWENPLV